MNTVTPIIIAYSIYLPVTIGLTYYVARVLFRNGKVFMLDIFREMMKYFHKNASKTIK